MKEFAIDYLEDKSLPTLKEFFERGYKLDKWKGVFVSTLVELLEDSVNLVERPDRLYLKDGLMTYEGGSVRNYKRISDGWILKSEDGWPVETGSSGESYFYGPKMPGLMCITIENGIYGPFGIVVRSMFGKYINIGSVILPLSAQE